MNISGKDRNHFLPAALTNSPGSTCHARTQSGDEMAAGFMRREQGDLPAGTSNSFFFNGPEQAVSANSRYGQLNAQETILCDQPAIAWSVEENEVSGHGFLTSVAASAIHHYLPYYRHFTS